MNDLNEIRDDLIKGGFPELIDEDIKVEYKKLNDALFRYGILKYEGFYIEVDSDTMGNAPTEVIKGGMAHDFCHIIEDIKMDRELRVRDKLAHKISKRYRILDERNTDLQAIIRGYGQELLSFMRYADKKGFPYYKEDGLSIRELEKILLTKK